MNAKYLTTLATVSILSLGLVTACADTADVDGGEVNEEVNPCAGADPCAGQN